MKKLLLIVLTSALALTSLAANAVSEDEQWPIPNEPDWGHHSVLIDEATEELNAFSLLKMYQGDNQYLCKSTSDEKCKNAMGGEYQAFLPTCINDEDSDCIASLTAVDSNGNISEGKLSEYIYGEKHPNEFQGDGDLTPKHASDPSLWSISGAPHAFGSEYLVMVSLNNNIFRGASQGANARFAIRIYPVSKLPTGNTSDDMNGIGYYGKCLQKVDDSGKNTIACGTGAQEFGSYRCAAKMIEAGTCLLRHAFPSATRYKISVRLSSEPAAMLHGRLNDPEISIVRSGSSTVINVEAGSVKVPVLYSGGQYSTLSQDLKDYWDQCISKDTCGNSTRRGTGSDKTNPSMRNIQDYAPSFGERALALVSVFSKYVDDKSVAAPSTWAIRTLSRGQMNTSTTCFNSGTGFIGVVTTNSTTYSEGPPKFEDGDLTYKVASLHFLSNGEEFRGTYNLVLRSDVARCLYGFTKAPISASISILSADGSSQVATTVVNERNNWLYLTASGFTFSSPTIKVKLSQEAPVPVVTSSPKPSPTIVAKAKTSKIECIKGKLIKKVVAVSPKCPVGYKKKG